MATLDELAFFHHQPLWDCPQSGCSVPSDNPHLQPPRFPAGRGVVMTWQYSPYSIPLGIGACVSIVLAMFAWRRHRTPGSVSFMGLMIGVTVWSLSALLEHAS